MATTSFFLPAGTITSATSVVGPFDISQFQTVSVGVFGTYVGVNAALEVSNDGTNWFPINAANIATSGVIAGATGVLTTNSSNAWDIAVGPFSQFRVRATAWTSGTASVQVAGGFLAYEPAANVQIANSPTVVLGTGAATIGVASLTPATGSGGTVTNHHLVAAATTNATSVKATAGSIGSLILANTSAAAKYFKLFNKASAPTVGTDIPNATVGIPAGQTLFWDPANYYRLSLGIAYSITNLSPDLDATAVTAGDVIVSLNYN